MSLHEHSSGAGSGHGRHPGLGEGVRDANRRRLARALLLALCYLVAEVVGGLLANSLALLADAGHMLADAASLALALFAVWVAQRPASDRFSYGYRRAEVLAALVNAVALLAVAIGICVEAYQRFRAPPLVDGRLVFGVASGGLIVNLAMLRILGQGRGQSLNVEGAWLHVLSDLLGSVAAILSGLLTWLLGWYWADPVASVILVVLVLGSAVSLLKRTATVLMEGTPAHIDLAAVRRCIAELQGVQSVHHLHVWTITGGEEALSAHVVILRGCDHDGLLERIKGALSHRFSIGHVTIQFEHQPCGDPSH
jgi:cobalt-zinc-cadmium efflux system protein